MSRPAFEMTAEIELILGGGQLKCDILGPPPELSKGDMM